MPEFIRFLTELREHMNAELTRSDVLRALIWPNAGLLIALIGAISAKADTWILQILIVLVCLLMVLYVAAYVFFALTDPDALRSEKYKLQKMAIERGLIGNSQVGLHEIEDEASSETVIDALPYKGEDE